MLKLKYLFNDVNLAEMLLLNWEYDKESIEMFKHYRISSNAIYPFKFKGNILFLRFAPKTEKSKNNIVAELDFISYLRANRFGVLESVLSKKGEELVEAQTPWGEYYASVFNCVSGVQINKTDFSDTVVNCHGKALGKLHQLSSEYTPPAKNKRWSYKDVFNWIQDILLEFPQESAALMELRILQDYFSSIPITKSNFGLIHYDFEYDNVFYDEAANSCNVIDFDDVMYHWYAMDIEQALDSLQDYIPAEIYNHKKQCFMDGYLSEYDISIEMLSILPECRRFANLYGYVRILRSVAEKWDNEPDWLESLRGKLTKAMNDKSASFEPYRVSFGNSKKQ
jgi:Ser/Thr protein kinase RdoA (MazF antagonist)